MLEVKVCQIKGTCPVYKIVDRMVISGPSILVDITDASCIHALSTLLRYVIALDEGVDPVRLWQSKDKEHAYMQCVNPNSLYRALRNQPLLITGTGEETRDFTFIEDISNVMLRVGVISGTVVESIDLSSDTETKVVDVANTINKYTGNEGINFVGRRDWDRITRRRASIEEARRILGYEPKADLKVGIKKTLD